MRNRIFGDRPWFLAQLEIEDNNGKRTVINSDESWKVSVNGPLKQSGIYEGETYDATINFSGWDKPGFNDKNWSSAVIADEKVNPALLTWQRNEPIRITNTIIARQVGKTPSGGLFFDIGENISGWAKISGSAPAGTTATLKYAEALNEDGSLWRDALWREGENIAAIDRYTFAGKGIESYEPHFTYHGFRYI
ncbi:MAG: alpha-L-rhamnosidase, partial [Chitinophagaceae bacterium]